ncbi:methyl-accepting chemotaxis protein, partial [Helicobacter monodelphidis]|uniref:cache domain-containing protein n=1 Tax=Helicobacter sp. 15-1451 TaxID=2004995 RepID=UPI000DCC2A1A
MVSFYNNLKIGTKLILIVLIIFAILLATVSAFNYQRTSKETVEVYGGIQQLALNAAYNTINITMDIEAQQHLKMIAESLMQVDHNDVVTQRNILRKASNLIEYPSIYVVYDSDGRTLIEDFKPNNHSPVSTEWDNLGELRDKTWYQEAKNTNKLIVTPTYESSAGVNKGKLLSTVAMPVTKNGQFIGVVGLDIFVDAFQRRFQNFKRPELPSMRIFMTDSTGRIFSHDDPAIVADPTPTVAEIALMEALKTSKEGKIFYRSEGRGETISFYKQFPFGWTIVSSASVGDYTGAINAALVSASLLALVLMVLGAIILFFILKKMLKPLALISDGLLSFFKYLNHETKTAPSPLAESKDELGVMAKAINVNVERTKQGLEQDANLVKESLDTIEYTRSSGKAERRIMNVGSNPQLNALRDSINQLLELLATAVGKNLPELNRVFDSYAKLDFTTEVQDANGRVEIVTNTLGEEIRKMLHTSANFAKDLESKSKDLEEAVR